MLPRDRAAGRVAAPVAGNRITEAMMLAATFWWASNIVAGKVALQAFGPLALAFLRMAGAAILFGAVYVARNGAPRPRFSRRTWGLLALMAATGITANQIFYIGGLAKTSVMHAGLIQALGPILVMLLSASLGTERLNEWKIAGMMISLAGVILLVAEHPAAGSGAHWSGDLMLILADAVFAYYTILTKEAGEAFDPLALNGLVFAIGVVFLAPICGVGVAHIAWAKVPPRAWIGLAYMIGFGSFAAYLIYAFALERLSASNVAAFAYLQPVMAALLGLWLLGERISMTAVAGGVLILGGVYLTERARGAHQHIAHIAAGRV